MPSAFLGNVRFIAPDLSKPVITLNAPSSIILNVGDTYTLPAATWTDNRDGSGTTAEMTVVNPVDTSTANIYTVTFDITDAAGNAADQVTQTVQVVAFRKAFLGNVRLRDTSVVHPQGWDVYTYDGTVLDTANTESFWELLDSLGYTLASGDKFAINTPQNLMVRSDTTFIVDPPGSIDSVIQVYNSGDTSWSADIPFTINNQGLSGQTDTIPELPVIADVIVFEGATSVATITATAGTTPITYSLAGPHASYLSITQAGVITLNDPAGQSLSQFEIILVASNDAGSAASEFVVSVSSEPALPSVGSISLVGRTPTSARAFGGYVLAEPAVGVVTPVGVVPADALAFGGEVRAEAQTGILTPVGLVPANAYAFDSNVITEAQVGVLTPVGLTPTATTFIAEVVANPSAGILNPVGLMPTAFAEIPDARVIIPNAGVSNIVGLVPDAQITTARIVTIPSGPGLVVSQGFTPTPIAVDAPEPTAEPLTGVLSAEGLTPTVNAGGGLVSVQPAIGTLTQQGLTPQVRAEGGEVRVTVPFGELRLEGQVPITIAAGGEARASVSTITTITAVGTQPNVSTGGGIKVAQPSVGRLVVESVAHDARAFGGYVLVEPSLGVVSLSGLTPSAYRGSPPSIGYFAGTLQIDPIYAGSTRIH